MCWKFSRLETPSCPWNICECLRFAARVSVMEILHSTMIHSSTSLQGCSIQWRDMLLRLLPRECPHDTFRAHTHQPSILVMGSFCLYLVPPEQIVETPRENSSRSFHDTPAWYINTQKSRGVIIHHSAQTYLPPP